MLHAGNLTKWGSFAELQAPLTRLSSQPHTHKVVIAGNDDVLIDRAFLDWFLTNTLTTQMLSFRISILVASSICAIRS